MKTYVKPLIILAVVLLCAHFWFNTVDFNGVHANIDLKHYRTMAAAAPGVLTPSTAPFAYRILPSWMAGVVGKGLNDELLGFRIVSVLSVLFAAMMLYVYLVSRKVRNITALTMACLAVISQHVLGSVVFNPFQICDALAIGLMLAMLLCIERAHIFGFFAASVIGALTREPCLLMIPVALTYVIWQQRSIRSSVFGHVSRSQNIVQWIAACVPAIVVAIVVRAFLIAATNTDWSLGAMVVENAYKFTDPETWARMALFAAAPISLFPFVFLRQTRTVLGENVHLVVLFVLVVASSFLGADTERLVAPAMVVYYLITARVMDEHSSWVLHYVLVLAALVCSLHPVYARFSPFTSIDGYGLGIGAFYLTSAMTMVVALIIVIVKTRYRTVRR